MKKGILKRISAVALVAVVVTGIIPFIGLGDNSGIVNAFAAEDVPREDTSIEEAAIDMYAETEGTDEVETKAGNIVDIHCWRNLNEAGRKKTESGITIITADLS